MLVPSLKRVDNAQYLCRVAASRSRIGQDGADRLLRVNNEHAPDGESNALGVDVGNILMVKPTILSAHISETLSCHLSIHVVGICNFPLLVTNDGKSQLATSNLIDVLDPPAMALNRVC